MGQRRERLCDTCSMGKRVVARRSDVDGALRLDKKVMHLGDTCWTRRLGAQTFPRRRMEED